jgi:hypothetical protein
MLVSFLFALLVAFSKQDVRSAPEALYVPQAARPTPATPISRPPGRPADTAGGALP